MPIFIILLLIFSWGGIIAAVLAIIGALRRRCPWYGWLIYAFIAFVASFLYQGLFYIAPYFSAGDKISTILSTATLTLGIVPGLIVFLQLLKDVWRTTNSRNY